MSKTCLRLVLCQQSSLHCLTLELESALRPYKVNSEASLCGGLSTWNKASIPQNRHFNQFIYNFPYSSLPFKEYCSKLVNKNRA